MTKIADVLYKVDCGRGNQIQVIHCDRMRKRRKQVLVGEETEPHNAASNDEIAVGTETQMNRSLIKK